MEFGFLWLQDQYRLCKEAELQDWNILSSIIPLARTPMSKEGGRAMEKASKKLSKMLMEALTPWINAHEERRKEYMRKYGVRPGEIVILDSGDGVAQHLKNKDTRIIKGK
jgi:hypothetical protein